MKAITYRKMLLIVGGVLGASSFHVQYLRSSYFMEGSNSNSVNGFIGLSFPLGKKKSEAI